MTVIQNAQIVLENGILWDGAIIIEDDRIIKYGKESELMDNVLGDAVLINAEGAYVGPGFVDLHVHEGGEYSTYYEPEESSDYFLRHGATSILATIPYDLDFEHFLKAINTVKRSCRTNRIIKGLYLEGPYTNPNYGSHSYANPWRGAIDQVQYKELVDAAGLLAKVWVVAPERPGILSFLEYAREVNPNVAFAVGHSEATPSQIRDMRVYRPILQTHSLNATGSTSAYSGTRGCGPDEYCLREPEMYAELISDSLGIHVCSDLQQLILRSKGIDRTILITDSTVYNEIPPLNLRHVKDLNFDANGNIAGSKMTMDQACRNIMTHTNCGIAQAFLMASRNPARIIGLEHEIGTIDNGKQADLVFVDDKFHVKQVMLGGKLYNYEKNE